MEVTMTNEDWDNSMTDTANLVRGTMMHLAVNVEKVVDYYISSKYCEEENKRIELILFVINKHTFANKIEIFGELISEYDIDFINKNPTILSDLDLLRIERNKFAHWPLQYTEESREIFKQRRSIVLGQLKVAKKHRDDMLTIRAHEYTSEAINRLYKTFADVRNSLYDLCKTFPITQ